LLAITSKSPYAVRALCELALCGASVPIPIGELARRRDIPQQFLEGLFATLRRAGILKSQRGVKGGYLFARSPSEVTVLEVVELLEGELAAGNEAEDIWRQGVTALRDVLARTTIADLAEREAQERGQSMYYI
jgi:Rrf2 family protein